MGEACPTPELFLSLILIFRFQTGIMGYTKSHEPFVSLITRRYFLMLISAARSVQL